MTTPSTHPIIEVAVGILLRSDGSLLFAQRPTGKTYMGYWEFPGGKLEANESVEQALKRELYEELGISIEQYQRWRTLEHHYAHAHVRLYFCKVTRWQGEPQGLERQNICWQKPPITLQPLLPATFPVLEWLVTA